MEPEILIRILDTDGARVTATSQRLQHFLQLYALPAVMETVSCHLEISRQGFVECDPVLQVNGFTVSSGVDLDDARLEDCCRRLAQWWQRKHSAPTSHNI